MVDRGNGEEPPILAIYFKANDGNPIRSGLSCTIRAQVMYLKATTGIHHVCGTERDFTFEGPNVLQGWEFFDTCEVCLYLTGHVKE